MEFGIISKQKDKKIHVVENNETLCGFWVDNKEIIDSYKDKYLSCDMCDNCRRTKRYGKLIGQVPGRVGKSTKMSGSSPEGEYGVSSPASQVEDDLLDAIKPPAVDKDEPKCVCIAGCLENETIFVYTLKKPASLKELYKAFPEK